MASICSARCIRLRGGCLILCQIDETTVDTVQRDIHITRRRPVRDRAGVGRDRERVRFANRRQLARPCAMSINALNAAEWLRLPG